MVYLGGDIANTQNVNTATGAVSVVLCEIQQS